MQTDFMTKIQGVEFEEAEKNKILLPLAGLQIPVIHFNKMVCEGYRILQMSKFCRK